MIFDNDGRIRRAMVSMATIVLAIASVALTQKAQTRSIAVGDLLPQGVKENEAVVISEQLRAQLLRDKRIRMIERSQMQEILKEQGFQQAGCTSDECAVQIGQLLGVGDILVGTVGVAGSYTVLTIRVLDVGSGEIVANESFRTKGGIDVLLETGISAASDSLLKRFFPQENVTAVAPSLKPKKGPGRGLVIGGIGAALVGGGIAAAVILTREDSTDPKTTNNTRLVLP